MEPKKKVEGRKLKLAKETITILDDQQTSGIKAGNEQPPKSTRYDFTCTLCTTIGPDLE